MPIIKTIAAPNGVSCNFHKAVNGEFNFAEGVAIVRYLSWPTEADHNAGRNHAHVWALSVPLASVPDVDAFATSQPAGLLQGGSIVADGSQTLASNKVRKRAQMKASRDTALDASLVTPWGTFNSDAEARMNILSAVVFMQALAGAGESNPVIDFTLEDDSFATLNLGQMISVGLLLGQKVQQTHARKRELNGLIESATEEQLENITWLP